MARKLRSFDPDACGRVMTAIADLRSARDWLRRAGANKAASYAQRALKSAEGAMRHCERIERSYKPLSGHRRRR